MNFRTARAWLVLAGSGAVLAAALNGSLYASVLGGVACVAAAAGIIWLDGLRRSGKLPR